jgi:hypothetical protein
MMKGADSSSETHGCISFVPTTRNVTVSCTEHSPNQSDNFPSAQTHFPPLGTHTGTAPPQSDQLSPLGSCISKPTAYPKHSLSLSLRRVLPILYNHFNVYCLYCTITTTYAASNVKSLRRVVPLLYNHFNVYCHYLQSLQRLLPSLYNHFNVYCLYLQSLQHLLPSLYNHFNVYCLYCTVTSTCTASTVDPVVLCITKYSSIYQPLQLS